MRGKKFMSDHAKSPFGSEVPKGPVALGTPVNAGLKRLRRAGLDRGVRRQTDDGDERQQDGKFDRDGTEILNAKTMQLHSCKLHGDPSDASLWFASTKR